MKKYTILVGGLFALCASLQAYALTATASPATCTTVAGTGTVNWTNPIRAISSNNSRATVSVDGTVSRYLQCTGYNFAIPVGSVINGITVRVERRSDRITDGGSRDAAMRVVKAGVIGATDRSSATVYPTTEVYEAHGGAADLWGEVWTPADINASNFGAALSVTKANAAGAAHTVSVDHIQIVVDYTPAFGIYSVTANPTACASVAWAGGTRPWGNTNRAYTSNNSYTTASVDGTTTRLLRCSGYNFAIPAGAVINGITVNVERRSNRITDGGSRDAAVRAVKGGVVGTTDKSQAGNYTTADTVVVYGSASDLWGDTWTPADINAANFGAAFAATKPSSAGAAHTISVDHMPITVTYTLGGLDHIRILHDGNGLTCTPSVLTVIACANATCTAPHYTASAIAGNVTWTGAPGGTVPFNITVGGTNTVNLPVTTVQTVTLGTSAVTPMPTGASDCVNGAGGTACSQPFADSGLLWSVSNHIAETTQNITLSAVRKADNALNCVPAFAGVSRAVNLRCSYVNPASGTLPVRIAGAALNAANNTAAACDGTGRNVTLAFDASGTAATTMQYADVGQMVLAATYTGSAANGDAGLVMTGSGGFTAAPASFAFSGITAGLIRAGAPFSATITARNNAGNATPNFGRESTAEGVTLNTNLVEPVGGSNPALANNVIPGSEFGSGGMVNDAAGVAGINNLSWGEVGLITLTANLSSGNYLSSGVVAATGTSGNVGRFIPHHLDTVISGAMPCPTGPVCPTIFYGFVYSGQPITLQVNALNQAGAFTQNYDKDFTCNAVRCSKAVTLTAWDALGSTTTQNPGPGVLGNNSIAATDFDAGIALINAGNVAPLTLAPVYTFTNAMTVPTAIFLRATDSDLVTSLRTPAASSVESGVLVVNGRVRVLNAYGSERLQLTMPVNVQYWNGGNWTLSTTDNATAFDTRLSATGNVVPTIIAGPLTLANIVVSGGGAVTVAGGTSSFILAAPNASGRADFSINAPVYLVPVMGRATFGVYSSTTPFIYQREAY